MTDVAAVRQMLGGHGGGRDAGQLLVLLMVVRHVVRVHRVAREFAGQQLLVRRLRTIAQHLHVGHDCVDGFWVHR